MVAIATSSTFSTGHIALAGAIRGAIAAMLALLWLREENRVLDTVTIGLLTAAAVFMLRKSANMPQLNNDGRQGFSANDWLAPCRHFRRARDLRSIPSTNGAAAVRAVPRRRRGGSFR